MTILSDSVLVESRAARDYQLRGMSHDRAQAILAKVKILYFWLWKGTGIATTLQIADFYEVPAANIRIGLNDIGWRLNVMGYKSYLARL